MPSEDVPMHEGMEWLDQRAPLLLGVLVAGVTGLLGLVLARLRRVSLAANDARTALAAAEARLELTAGDREEADPDGASGTDPGAEAAEPAGVEEALRESERRLRAVLETIPLLAVILDREGRIAFCNEELARVVGWSRDELLGQDWAEVGGTPEDGPTIEVLLRTAADEARSAEADVPLLTRSGERRVIAWNTTVLRDDSGEPSGIARIGQDVTEERRVQEVLRESELQYHSLFEENHAVMLLSDPGTGVIVDANPAACAFYGFERERMLLMKLQDLAVESEREVFEEMQRASDERRSHFRFRHRLSGGDVRDVEVYTGPVTIHGRPVLYSLVFDVTERRRAEGALRESEQRFRAVFDGAPIGVARLDTAGRIVEVNMAMQRLFGRDEAGFRRASIVELFTEEDRSEAQALVEDLSTGRRGDHEVERGYRRSDGSVFWGRTAISLVRDAAGFPSFAIAMIQDVTDRKHAEEELTHRALHDALTGLANRTLFLDHLEIALARRNRGKGEVAVLFLDLDGFKAVNDGLGHEAGDELLRVAAGRIERSVRPSDTVARFGGDEFVVLCEDIGGVPSAEAVARRISVALAEPFVLGGHEARVSASIGVALSLGRGDEPEALLRDADAAMYAAKKRGRARWEVAHRSAVPAPGPSGTAADPVDRPARDARDEQGVA